MRRRDWAPLADTDPVPGEVEELEALAQRYHDTAQAIRDARSALEGLHAHEGWESDAGREFTRRTRSTAEQVGQALVRYERAAEGLSTYVRALRDVQDDAEGLRVRAVAAQQDIEVARAAERRAADAPPESPEAATVGQRAADVSAAVARLEALRATLAQEVVPRWQAAGNAAAATLQDIAEVDGLKDSRWQDLVGGMKALGTWAGKAAAVLGVLALVCAVVPVLAPFAALFGALALAASVVSLAGNAVAYSQGRTDLSTVLWSLAGVLTFGAGRALTSTARVLGKAAASTAKPSYISALRGAGHTKKQARSIARTVSWTGTRGIPNGPTLAARARGRLPWVPRPREVLAAVDPRTVVREVATDLRALRDGGPLWGATQQAALDAARALPGAVRATPGVATALRPAETAVRAAYGAGAASTYNDLRELGLPLPPGDRPTLPRQR